MKIACWSGPRNISTALMRSWSSRMDTFVSDEPFYAYYLKEKKLKHPMYKEIINHYPNTYDAVVNSIIGEIPQSKKIWYQKHMAHHLINLEDIEWIKDFHNYFLIRHPKDVINSYIKKNKLHNVYELGYPQQYRLIQYLEKNEKNILVIDSSILLKDPRSILNQWCKKLNIDFDAKMLTWKKGCYPTDGIWWKHWYNNIINTNQFEPFHNKSDDIPKEYQSIYNEALDYYEKLYYFSMK
tara:strand:- start:7923 stop:8639 length:717 start_codon:yes stop_codon:yes gene_type:complete